MARAVVAIVGRPNVGKSTLFNRLIGERIAIVEDVPGTTRDRIYATTEWRGREFSLIDTGGLEDPRTGQMEAAVRRQAEAAIAEADVVMFLVDAQSGVLPVEHDVADLLRRSRKPVLLVANKADSWRGEAQSAEFYELGLGTPLTVSAIQGIGTGDLLDAVVERLPPETEEVESADAHVAIVGRPNVGKSSFLNTLASWFATVRGETPRRTAIWALERPSATSPSTPRSAAVTPAMRERSPDASSSSSANSCPFPSSRSHASRPAGRPTCTAPITSNVMPAPRRRRVRCS